MSKDISTMHDDTITLPKYSCGDSSLLTYIYGESEFFSHHPHLIPQANN